MKIVKTEQEKLIFNDGSEITSNWHWQCCEYNYADFTQIDDLAKEWEFENPLSLKNVMVVFVLAILTKWFLCHVIVNKMGGTLTK
jgi:hypothetical protein